MCVAFTLCFWFLFRGLRTAEGASYFTNILETAFELYVLVTTANSPDVMYASPPSMFMNI
jgi:5'(3')-deoxyribonucleotidase